MALTLQLTISDEQMAELVDRLAEKIGGVSRNPLTVAEFAAEVGRDPKTIRRLIQAGVILKSGTPGDTMIPYSELERYRNGGKPTSKTQP